MLVESLWIPKKVKLNWRMTMTMSPHNKITRIHDMNRLLCQLGSKLSEKIGVVIQIVIIITFHVRRNAKRNGIDLVYYNQQLAVM
jgi:hypothetical protein